MSINVFLRQFEGQNFPYGRLKDRLAKIYHTGVRRLAQRRNLYHGTWYAYFGVRCMASAKGRIFISSGCCQIDIS